MDLDIISAIRRLDGRNLGEVRKKFFTYILVNKIAITSNIGTILDLFIPENNLEKFFRIKLIDLWRRKLELARIFEKEDTFYISRALKCKWFFREIEIDPAVLVNEILPNLSYFTRQKLIRQYSKYLKDKNKAEELFKALQKRYGTSFAQIILPACSSEFIKTTLQSSRVRVNRDLITLIYKNHPDIVVNFISSALASKASGSRLYENFDLRSYVEILKLIAIYHPKRFVDMFIEYKDYFPYMSLGANVTKRIVKTYSPLVIKHFRVLKEIMPVKKVIKIMSISNIEKLQASYFPESMIDFYQLRWWEFEELGEITSRLDEVESQQVLLRNFKRCYGKEFHFEDFRKVIDLCLIILLPVEIRKKWIQLELPKLESDSEKAEYLGYLPPDIGLPQIKKLIVRQKEVSVRAEMVHYMLLSAIRYKKTHNSLLDCFAFLVGRLRTDSGVVRVKVFRELEEMKDILLNMSVKEWETVEEFIDLIRMNDEDQGNSYEFITLCSLKIQRYLAEGRPMDGEISNFIEYAFSIHPYYDLSLCKGTPYRKRCLEICISSLPNIVFERVYEKDEAFVRLLSILCDYNRSFKHEKIDYPDWLITEIQKLFASKECSHYSKTQMIKSICKDAYLRNRIYDVFPCIPTLDVIRHVLRGNPSQLKKHKETVMKEILKTKRIKGYIKLFKDIKLYVPFELPFVFQEFCECALKTKQLDSEIYKPSFKPNAVTFLSILMPSKEFIETITPYSLTLKEIGSYSEENKLLYKIHKAIASSLKFVAAPLRALTCAKLYTFGDYLKFILGPINSICTKVPENKILPYLLEWENSSLSLKKHLMRTYCKIAPTTDAGKLILSLLDKEEYKSLRPILLEYIFRFFLYDPCEERFNFFKTAYSQLTPDDVKCVDVLFDLTRIPDIFVESFLKILWEAVELKEGLLVSGSRNKIIKMIDADVLCLLSEDFCELLLRHLFSNEDITSNLEFIIKYLMYSQNETILFIRLDKVIKYVNDNILNNWNMFTPNCNIVFRSKNTVFEITESICRYSLKKEKLKICADSILEKWKLFLLTSFSADEIVEELLYLESTIFIYNKDMEKSNFSLFCSIVYIYLIFLLLSQKLI